MGSCALITTKRNTRSPIPLPQKQEEKHTVSQTATFLKNNQEIQNYQTKTNETARGRKQEYKGGYPLVTFGRDVTPYRDIVAF